ncbi:hypothetical protein [Ferrovibrio sp.]|uniref:hypothetical protein n=1 Tax=Ferrovibrio sp. TaxID=1917215 RepID=UPI0026023FAD|nr:hypothetical protein [Ferrovibrio sp.]
MAEKQKPKKPDKEKPQKERFKEAARARGTDETEDALDRAFGKLKVNNPGRSY